MDPRVSSQLVRPAEAFGAARKLTTVRFLARMCPDVSCLMLQAVKGLIAEWALVGSREILAFVLGQAAHQGR